LPEWRKDPLVDRWVIIATERGKRPSDFKIKPDEKKGGRCPMCVGHEKDTPPEVAAFRESGSAPDAPGWWVRVVPNKFPAVRIEAQPGIRRHGIYETMDGLGAHEVVVETTEHEKNLEFLPAHQVEEVIWAWQQRSLDLRRDARFKYIQIFKNFAQTAGASLEHPHSQIVALPMVPADVAAELDGMRRYAQNTGRCIICDLLGQELAEKQRVVREGEKFVALAPFASRFPFETWIVPREHQHDFAALRPDQVADLARVLRSTLRALHDCIGEPPYNLVLHTAPINDAAEAMHYHWHLEILPRLTVMAGFELGTGYFINPTPPELAAQVLREEETRAFTPIYAQPGREVAQYV